MLVTANWFITVCSAVTFWRKDVSIYYWKREEEEEEQQQHGEMGVYETEKAKLISNEVLCKSALTHFILSKYW